MNPVVEDILMHYGMPRRSGRYPWGSGDDPYQRNRDFLSRVEELKKRGWTETAENIKKEFGLTTGQYREEKSICKDQRRLQDVARAKSLKADYLSNTEIGRIMGINESSVRSLLDPKAEARMMETGKTVKFLRDQVNEKGMIDVGVGVGKELNISDTRLETALYYLSEKEGYPVYNGRFQQPTNPGQWTTQRVLCKPGTEYKEIYNLDQVKTIKDYISRDDGQTYEKKFYYPASMDSKRMQIRYKEDGGIEKDGIIELRRGVDDLSLGEKRYAQVRILVDDKHYLKGMAVYGDDKDFPPGVDVIFNTNKTKGTPKEKVMKEIKDDPDNPFGSLIKDADQGGQYWYDADTGKRCSANDPNIKNKKLGLINKRADEGDWEEWADALPSQFLSKQSKTLAKQQLDLAKEDKIAEYNDICSLTNPTIKKHLLEKFADNCDAAAVDLKAAALPGQKYHVIIPISSLKDDEIYAPKYEDGTKLALIRYPHGGTFEIPIVKVNNKHTAARKLLGTDISDAVGINNKVAERLSGADFDGDTVMCIPTHDKAGKVKIVSTPQLKDLEGFDPKIEYGPETYAGRNVKLMTKKGLQLEMGKVSNLITDMTLAGADEDELARAVKHSMVVIDAYKHKLDYKKSEIDNNITGLKKDYQPKFDDDGNLIGYGGASTIISRSKGEYSVVKRQGSGQTNIEGNSLYDPSKPKGSKVYRTADDLYYPERTYDKKTGLVTLRTSSGKKIQYDVKDDAARTKYEPVKKVDPNTGEVSYTNKKGDISYRVKTKMTKSTRMAETDDAYTLVSKARHPMEIIYADYANSMKSLANQARIEVTTTGKIEYNKAARLTYQKEVDSLMKKLNDAQLNTTRERAAQRMAAATVQNKKKENSDLDKSDIKKIGQQAVTKYRTEVGSISRKDRNIKITDKEWEAIQAGAISENKLKHILNNTDIDVLRERATPKTYNTLSTAKQNRIKNYSSSGLTISQIANKLGVSPSTVSKYLKGSE